MRTEKSAPRWLGAAFLFQAIASLVSGLFLLQPLIVEGDIAASMANIAAHPLQMRAAILGEMLTAFGIVALGALLYVTLKRQDERVALIALALYVVEAGLLAGSQIPAYGLLEASRQAAVGAAADLRALGEVFYAAQDFGFTLHMLAFGLGGTLFYALFYRSGLLPRWMALWGLIAAPLSLAGMLLVVLGAEVPIVVFLPNLPFELGVGLWLLIKRFRAPELVAAPAA